MQRLSALGPTASPPLSFSPKRVVPLSCSKPKTPTAAAPAPPSSRCPDSSTISARRCIRWRPRPRFFASCRSAITGSNGFNRRYPSRIRSTTIRRPFSNARWPKLPQVSARTGQPIESCSSRLRATGNGCCRIFSRRRGGRRIRSQCWLSARARYDPRAPSRISIFTT